MNDLPLTLAAFALALGILIVVHEFGHYIVARWCGVKVLRFSIGFGPVLWQRQLGRDATEWAISALPLGGYVKMLDEREGEVAEEDLPRAFNRQGVGRRSLIVVAGPLANLLLAIVLYWAVFLHGTNELLPVLGAPAASTPAAAAGIRSGDQVTRIDDEAVATWDDFRWQLLQEAASRAQVTLDVIDVDGIARTRVLALDAVREEGWEGDPLVHLGLRFYRPDLPAVIGRLVDGGPGARAGLREGDRVLAIDGHPLANWQALVLVVREAAGRSLRFDIERQGVSLQLDLTPDEASEGGQRIGRIGVAVAETPESRRELRAFVRYGVVDAGRKAIFETWDKSIFSLRMMGKMLTGEVSWKNLSGPVTIADYAGQTAKLGIDYYVRFMALISISLGVLNLLPVPVLDGGHLMYHMIEVVRRKPLSERAMAIGQQFGLAILFSLMAFAFFNDLNRLFGG